MLAGSGGWAGTLFFGMGWDWMGLGAEGVEMDYAWFAERDNYLTVDFLIALRFNSPSFYSELVGERSPLTRAAFMKWTTSVRADTVPFRQTEIDGTL